MSSRDVARKLLWGRSGNRCAWRDCRQRLTALPGEEEAGVLADQGVAIGEEAHIRSKKKDGPRYDPRYPPEKLDTYENLILLCSTHHTVIDKQNGAGWPVDRLKELKSEHEERVAGFQHHSDLRRQELDERITAQLAVWEQKSGFEPGGWRQLTTDLNMPDPRIHRNHLRQLVELGHWLQSRSWPTDLPRIRIAFRRHTAALQQLLRAANGPLFDIRGNYQILIQAHKHTGLNPGEYQKLRRQTNIQRRITWYLTAELGRSANLVIDAVQHDLDPLYRLDEGVILNWEYDGSDIDQSIREEYEGWNWVQPPPMPTVEEVGEAIEAAAGPGDAFLDEVDHRALGL